MTDERFSNTYQSKAQNWFFKIGNGICILLFISMVTLFPSCEQVEIIDEVPPDNELNGGGTFGDQSSGDDFFRIEENGIIAGFSHIPYSGYDSLIVEFVSDLQMYDSIYSIVDKWTEQKGYPHWHESLVLKDENGISNFAVIPFREEVSLELKSLFILSRHEGSWFFETWAVSLIDKAITAERGDDKMEILTELYLYFITSNWNPQPPTQTRTIVCERVYFIHHGDGNCLRICIRCENNMAFTEIQCPEPYHYIAGISFSSCSGGGGGGSGSGNQGSPLDINDWDPYFGSPTNGNPISWLYEDGMSTPNYPGGMGSAVDEIGGSNEADDRRDKARELVELISDFIKDWDLDLTFIQLRDLLEEDNYECLNEENPELCMMLTILEDLIAPDLIPSEFLENTAVSLSDFSQFIYYVNDIESLLGQPFTTDHLDWIFESDENFLVALELLEFLEEENLPVGFADFAFEVFLEDFSETTSIEGLIDISLNLNDYRAQMSESELALFDSMSYLNQLRYLYSAYQAVEKSESLYPTWLEQWNGIGDAFRHAYWNALGARRFGDSLMEDLATAHEDKPPSYEYKYKENDMDLFNNNEGRSLSSESGKLWQVVKSALEAGDLRYLHPRGFTIEGVFNPPAANEQSQLIPTNQ